MKTKQKAFTLIEIMIVIAIVGIIAAIALPMYQDYMLKSKTVEAIVLLGAAKLVVDEHYHTEGRFSEDIVALGIKTTGKYVNNMVISDNEKTIIAEMDLGNLGVYYSVNSNTWICFNSNSHGMGEDGIASKYIPIECQN